MPVFSLIALPPTNRSQRRIDRVLSLFTGHRTPQNPFPKSSPFHLAWQVSRNYHFEWTPEEWLAALLGEKAEADYVR